MRAIVAAALKPFQRHGGLVDYGVSFAGEGVTLVLGLIVFKLAASYWGPEGFGEYVLARRGIALLYLPLSCGMGMAVTRTVAVATGESHRTILGAAAAIAGVATAVATLAILFAPEAIGTLLFGEPSRGAIVRQIALAVAGLVAHSLVYSFFRGRLQMITANMLQVINLGLVPVLVFLVPNLDVPRAMTLLGAGWLGVTFVALPVALRRRVEDARGDFAPTGDFTQTATGLARYGLPRVPGEFALSALFALPGIFAAHLGGVTVGGYVSFAASLLTMVGSAFAPLGVILLPSVSAAVARGEGGTLWRDALRMTAVCVLGATMLTLGLEILAPFIVARGLGSGFADALPAVRIIALAGVPYAIYVLLRNMLDAASVRAINARNVIINVMVMTAVVLGIGTAAAVPWALLAAVTLLGVMTFIDARAVLARLGQTRA